MADTEPTTPDLSAQAVNAVLAGLRATPRQLASSLHYDPEGSALFDEIARQPEYYPPAAEREILSSHLTEILGAVPWSGPADATLLELGACDDGKADRLLDAGAPRFRGYIPINIDASVLDDIAGHQRRTRPDLRIGALQADFMTPFRIPQDEGRGTLVVFFPGSTIGQCEDHGFVTLMENVRAAAAPWANSAFVVTSDACRDLERLELAYDDPAGANAAFNLHLLDRLNTLGDGTFRRGQFRHAIRWNEGAGRVEFNLESLVDQDCRFAGETFGFARGELLQTGISYKRTRAEFVRLARAGGWSASRVWTDPERLVDVHLLVPAA